jgi:CRP/FNR family transcriptional regulator, cyclic AMP receptor protein
MSATDKLKIVEEGTVIIEEGDNSEHLFWLKSGLLVVTKENGDETITLGNINPGEVFGEMSFFDKDPRSATVSALAQSEILIIPQKKYHDMLMDQPKWMQNLLQNLVDRLRNTNNKVKI